MFYKHAMPGRVDLKERSFAFVAISRNDHLLLSRENLLQCRHRHILHGQPLGHSHGRRHPRRLPHHPPHRLHPDRVEADVRAGARHRHQNVGELRALG